jgi:Flp pilus assembly pilin Flp
MASLLTKLWQDRRGQDITEYALIGGLVATLAVAIIPDMFSIVTHIEETLMTVLDSAVDAATLK